MTSDNFEIFAENYVWFKRSIKGPYEDASPADLDREVQHLEASSEPRLEHIGTLVEGWLPWKNSWERLASTIELVGYSRAKDAQGDISGTTFSLEFDFSFALLMVLQEIDSSIKWRYQTKMKTSGSYFRPVLARPNFKRTEYVDPILLCHSTVNSAYYFGDDPSTELKETITAACKNHLEIDLHLTE
ncbi:hypothetical protein [Corynebacterium cystitidis]|uniref:hypothetical protein n=1 Tax=Corynebacterium cystitidis TaxID=35757 RepID=UPI00211F24E4|nr:hypothetical protein [Corynebacterium cystitidis]